MTQFFFILYGYGKYFIKIGFSILSDVFAWPHTRIGERIVVQVVSTEVSYIGSLAFGLTNCDPSTIDVRELPEDSDLLLDRPEYWVVSL